MATTAAEGAATIGGGGERGGLPPPSDHETTTTADAEAAAPPSALFSPLTPSSILAPPPRTTTTTTKRCDGSCGLTKDESGYSITMWSRGANRRRTCLVCSRLPPLPPIAPPLVVVGRGGEEEGSDDVLATAATTTTTRKRGATTTLNLLAGGIDDDTSRYTAAPPPRSRRRRIADGAPPPPPTGDGGGRGAVRSWCCACRDPSACHELLRRWARLADEDEGGGVVASAGARRVGGGRRAVEYVVLPRPSAAGGVGRGATRAERHADACRRVAFRGLGYGGGGGDDASSSPADAASGSGAAIRVGGATGAEAPTGDVDRPGAAARTTTRKRERIALVHFHPDVVPYLLRDGEVGVVAGGAGGGSGGCCYGNRDKSDGWRVPLDLGDAIGYAEGNLCPDFDSNDLRTYFAVPNYSLESAAADVARAEERSRDRARTIRAEYASLTREVSEFPGRVVSRMQDLRRANDHLARENVMLRERLGREGSTRSAMAAKAARLRRCIEKMARRLERLETNAKGGNPTSSSGGRGRASQSSSSSRRGNGRSSARGGCKDAAGQNLVSEEEINGNVAEGRPSSEDGDMGRSVAVRDGRGGRRWSDPRMDRAVEARWRDPSLSAEEALRIGGYVFPPPPSSSDDADGKVDAAAARREVVDSDNVSIAQRKNNLLRRLRLRRNALAAAAREGSGCDADVPLE